MQEESLRVERSGVSPVLGSPWTAALSRLYRRLDLYIAFSLCFVFYWLLGDFSDFETHGDVFHLEYPFVLYLFYFFNQALKPNRFRPLLAALPVFGAYLLYDLYRFVFNDVPDFNQVADLPELFTVASLGLRAALLLVVAAGLFFLLRLIQFRRRTLLLATPLLLLVLAVGTTPVLVVDGIDASVSWLNPYVRSENAARNGRFVVAIFNEAKRRIARSHLEGYMEMPEQEQGFTHELAFLKSHLKDDRQVFFVVLESFLDPRLLKPLQGHDEYIDAKFRQGYDDALGFSVSPRFAGGTAQAEFEILCGVPAFSEFEQTEFNLFTGSSTPCLPRVLSELGYDTVSNYPYIPSFFNAQRAYPGLGFQESYYAREHTESPTYLHLEQKGQYLFDGLLYAQNREYLEHRPPTKRLFNYVLTLYGHLYFEVQRPMRFEPPTDDKFLQRITNITYYRTGPLADYLDWLRKTYPKSLIVAVGDHVPGLQSGPDSYKQMGYLDNIKDSIYHTNLLVIENGKPKKLPTINHFGIPYLVYDYLTDGAFCKAFECPIYYPYDKERLRDRYRYLVAEANRDNAQGLDERKQREALLAQRVRYLNEGPKL